MEQRLTIVGLGVSDLKKATTFYEEKFGWEKADSSTDTITFLQLNGILLSLYPREKLAEDAQVPHGGNGFKGFTLAHNLRSKTEVDQLFSELEQKGVTIVKQPEEVFWGGYSGYVSDLDDNLWEIAFNPFLPLDEKGNTLET
ncbi:VOC family protein [Hyunsoonleella pacifica]|uniref:VOC family protein n=1 Tax=Hyunsoonleella pacifica TaxID=1080224 RepID=A0A4Q9FKR9_9FLAO|nr:VOC family protein [Hyunsoonleella pacifica]TBN14495.1 VOC family protein [Hyunsoonleella pacifica]GGD14203.1 glyoxalase [Hyunsoonleella pacifica]